MKKICLSIVLFSSIIMLASFEIYGQNSSSGKIIICGKIDRSKIADESQSPVAWLINNFQDPSANINETGVFPVKIMRDSFYVSIADTGDIKYINFKNIEPFENTSTRYQFTIGDSIHIGSSDFSNFVISGKGSAKIRCQLMLDTILLSRKAGAWADTLDLPTLTDKYGTEVWKKGLKRMEEYRKVLSPKVFNLLRLNFWTKVTRSTVLTLSSMKPSFDHGVKNRFVILDSLVKDREFMVDEIYWLRASHYLSNLGYLYMAYVASQPSQTNAKTGQYIAAYKYVMEHHKGLLRDRLASYILTYALTRDSNSLKFFPAFINQAQDSLSKNLVMKAYEANKPSSPAAELNLEDMEGKMYKLADFKGKKIVLKFWFNGCTGCAIIKENMHAVEQKFKMDKETLFLSVNVDKDKSMWISGLASKKYGNEGELNLYTAGLGYYHPMLMHYKYLKYPQLLIINPEGKVISSNPPVPYTAKDVNELTKIISK